MSVRQAAAPGHNLPEYSVSEVSGLLKRTIEDQFGQVRIRGEIGDCKRHSSGHVYLSLKDDGAVLAAVIWKGQAMRLGLVPEPGMEVVCIGRITTYAGQSKYQLVVEAMTLAGAGALLKLIEDRKKKLAAEGLFAAERKQELPFLPQVIGVVTSPTGAVIRDILHRLRDRFPCHVLVWPVAVQGEGAAQQITAAIEGFNALPVQGIMSRPDVLIVARGGGSLEDLMPFNEENVVRAAAASMIPLISAVGHETDTTLIDYAADKRAPTPTAAAEMAVPVRADLLVQVNEAGVRLQQATQRLTTQRYELLQGLVRALGDPMRVLEPLAQRCDERAERLPLAMYGMMQKRLDAIARLAAGLRHPRTLLAMADQKLVSYSQSMQQSFRHLVTRHDATLERLKVMLGALSPLAVLQRGYVLVTDEAGLAVTSQKNLQTGQQVKLCFHDGERKAVVKPQD